MLQIPPVVAEFITESLYPVSLLLAVTFPFLRAFGRYKCNAKPAFLKQNVAQDVGGGFVLPHFIVIAISPMSPGLLTHIEGHAYALAGLLGAFIVVTDLVDHSRNPASRGRKTDNHDPNQ